MLPVLPGLRELPGPHQERVPQELPVLPVLRGLQLRELPVLLLSCSLLPRWIKKPIKAR